MNIAKGADTMTMATINGQKYFLRCPSGPALSVSAGVPTGRVSAVSGFWDTFPPLSRSSRKQHQKQYHSKSPRFDPNWLFPAECPRGVLLLGPVPIAPG